MTCVYILYVVFLISFFSLSHSIILDVQDKGWLEYFEESELAEIRHYKCTDLPPVKEEVEKYLSELRGISRQELYTKISPEEIPLQADKKWVQDTFAQSVRLLRSGFVPIGGNVTEGGLLKRVWGCVDSCFDFSTITCIRYSSCFTIEWCFITKQLLAARSAARHQQMQ